MAENKPKGEGRLTNINQILTVVLIIVTGVSVFITYENTRVFLYLDNLRQKEVTISQIDKTDKLIAELEENKIILEKLNSILESFKTNGEIPIDVISIGKLETASETIDNLDQELVIELAKYEGVFKLVIQNMDGLKKDNIELNLGYKNDTIDRTKQNVGVLLQGGTYYGYKLYGLPDLIGKLENHKQELQEKLDGLMIIK